MVFFFTCLDERYTVYMGKDKCTMWMDAMDDKLEKTYEARPWRWYIVDALEKVQSVNVRAL